MSVFDFFRGGDYLVLGATVMFVALALQWKPFLARPLVRLSAHSGWCMLLLATLPLALRLALLPHHPIPTPNLYDEFGHLLVADTLRHFRFANPPNPLPQFFETFFVLQQPTYSSIYPIGQGLVLALAWNLFGTPWAGVLITTSAFCALSYWMLRAWITPAWAFVGGLLAVAQFGPLNLWTNSYWGGSLTATAGCLVFGSLPRIHEQPRLRTGMLLGMGLFIHFLTRPYESILLLIAVCFYFFLWRTSYRMVLAPAAWILFALVITVFQNKAITGDWATLPYQLSQLQYGVPAALTFETPPDPHRPLTPQQALDYRMQKAFTPPGGENLISFARRLLYRVRFLRFFFLPPLYIALVAFLLTARNRQRVYVLSTLLVFALGTNFFPAFQFHYVAAVSCLFLLVAVQGLKMLEIRSSLVPQVILATAFGHFAVWYTLHAIGDPVRALPLLGFETWDSVHQPESDRRTGVAKSLAEAPGNQLVFVHYSAHHIFQDEWVYNSADIAHAPVIWARDLGPQENEKLLKIYPARTRWLLEADSLPLPVLTPYTRDTHPVEPSSPSPFEIPH